MTVTNTCKQMYGCTLRSMFGLKLRSVLVWWTVVQSYCRTAGMDTWGGIGKQHSKEHQHDQHLRLESRELQIHLISL